MASFCVSFRRSIRNLIPQTCRMLTLARISAVLLMMVSFQAPALDLVRVETGADQVFSDLGITGKDVVVAVLDRGIDWSHPDFINEDGTTRIKWMLDQSGFNLCDPANPQAIEYSEADINQALDGGPSLSFRDAVGHGTATAGMAAGNGRALPDGRYRGIAPEADLIIIKMTSEGAPAHDSETAETFFQGCIDDALDWLKIKLDELGKPAVAIINSGTQWGPMDGTSAVSRKIDEVFPPDQPGRIMVMPSGDEGSLPNHSRTTYSDSAAGEISISRASATTSVMSAWNTGSLPASITVTFDDGTSVGPVAPGSSLDENGIFIINYQPGSEFYPWLSTSGDSAAWIRVTGHATTGKVIFQGINSGTGTADLYGDVIGPNLTPVTSMTDKLTPGRLNDYATTHSVISVANHVIRTAWTDIDGIPRSINDEGLTGELWLKSSGGPTRDGRAPGIDVSAPGQNSFTAVGPNSFWATGRGNLPQGSNSQYIRFGGTSGSAPIVVGTIALMLQANPNLTTNEVRQILRNTAVTDNNTGAVPNNDWGWGKLNILAAVQGAAFTINAGINDAWVSDGAPLQGMFITIFPNLKFVFLAWFTFDSVIPGSGSATFGAIDQRWVTAAGGFEGNTATLSAELTTGGRFNSDTPLPMQVAAYGTVTVTFKNCSEVTEQFDFPGVRESGEFTIKRVLNSNVPLCESLNGD
ncbi:MAG: S8 family serine peptidase [Xanthomonadales bacterium]|nr:S8 family serine peptidase [Xanthomonadales bacterium]